jgi:hypothetical protein
MARIRDWASALGEVAQSRPLRRTQASFGAMWASESAFMVGLAVVAFRDGGVVAVGVVTGARMAAAALTAPFLATVADRVRRELVLTGVGVVRAVMLGAAAAADGAAAVTYTLAVVAAIAQTLFRPAHSALLPALCTSPPQLTSANAVHGMLATLAADGGRHGRRAAPGVRHHHGRPRPDADHRARRRADVHARRPPGACGGGRRRSPGHRRTRRRRAQRCIGAGGVLGSVVAFTSSAAASSPPGSGSASRCSGRR